MLRSFAILLALAGAAVLPAQTSGPATDAVRWCFQGLASSRSIRVRLSGTETFGTSSIPLAAELYWHSTVDPNGQPLVKTEYTEYRAGILVQRSVGDGKTFYSYSPLRNEYWVASYGTHGPAAPARYLANLVDNLTSATKGSATYLSRLLREVYVVNGYRAWIPGGQEDLVVKNELPVVDPAMPSRVYVGSDFVEYGLFWHGAPAKRSLAFEFAIGGSAGRELKGFWFTERSELSGTARVVDWRADIDVNFVPAASNFVFVPPASARIIIGPKPNIG